MTTKGRAVIFFSLVALAGAMFKKTAKQLVIFGEHSQRSGVSGNGNRSRLDSGGNVRNFGSTGANGILRAGETPVTPALLAAQPLKWIHVPKCGTSFLNALSHLPGVCPGVDDSFQVNSDVLGNRFELHFYRECRHVCDGTKFMCLTKTNVTNVSQYIPHMGIGDEYDLLKGHIVTMFRDPIQRIFSAWNDPVFKHGAGHKSFLEYVHSEAHALTCQIMGDGIMDPLPTFCKNMTEADARLALVRIREGFAFAGIVEEWDLSMCLFHRMFGGDCLHSEFMDNRPTFSGETTYHSYDTSELGGYDDPVDRLLYNGAKELFLEKLREYNVSHESCQPCYAQAQLQKT